MGHTIVTIFLPRSYCPDIPGWGFVFQQDGALAHQARDGVAFLARKVPDFISPTLWPQNSPGLNPVDYSIWSVLHEKVYRSIIATYNISEFDVRLINERGRFVQSILDSAICQWRVVLALVSVERGTL